MELLALSLAALWGGSGSLCGDKRPEEREAGMEPSPSLPRWGKRAESGCWRGVGGWMGPASDLRQKECPRLLSRPAPLAALHTVINAGAFVFTFQTSNSRAEATDELTATPHSPCCCTVHYDHTVPASSASPKSWFWRHCLLSVASHWVLPQSCFFPFAPRYQNANCSSVSKS